MKNVELKLELRDPDLAISIAKALGGSDWGTLHQTDTYYNVLSGRLKRRETKGFRGGDTVEYIRYERPDKAIARTSTYQLFSERKYAEHFGSLPSSDGSDIDCTVTKTRRLFVVGGVRIHIDHVEHLGHFIEFEVPYAGNEQTAYEKLDTLREKLKPAIGEPISQSYADLIKHAQATDATIVAKPASTQQEMKPETNDDNP